MVETKKTLRREAVTGVSLQMRITDKSLTLTQADNSLFRLLGMNAGSLKSGTPISFLDRICAEDRPIFPGKNHGTSCPATVYSCLSCTL
ncbi:MAG: hypothetical protein ACLTW9_08320 [Enterocloster sp.]